MTTAVLFFTGLVGFAGGRNTPCSYCWGKECEKKPDNCQYGEAKVCGRVVCAKGPAESCGGSFNQIGVCGGGMYCHNCGFCKGCSTEVYRKTGEQLCYNPDALWNCS